MLPTIIRSAARRDTLAWVGLGAMGHPMALNLFSKTYRAHCDSSSASTARSPTDEPPSFLICEQSPERVTAFIDDLREKAGAEVAQRVTSIASGREAAVGASRILTMLPSTPQVEAVYLDESTGILAGLRSLPADTVPLGSGAGGTEVSSSPHTLLIDQTTLDPTAAMRVAATVHAETDGRAVMLDAPVSGGIVAAAAGALTIMFGSPSPLASSLATPLLQHMARDGGVVPCGGNGTGVGVKVCNNLILAINQVALAEGLALGRSLGIDPLLLHNVINTSSGQSWSSRVNTPLPDVPNSPGSRAFSGGFQSRLMLKDVGLALHAAHTYDLPTPLTWAAKSVYDAVCAEGDGSMATKDFSVVYKWLLDKQAAGVEKGWKDGSGVPADESDPPSPL